MSVTKKSSKRLSMADQFKLMKWMDDNKDVLLQYTRTQLIRKIHSEIGLTAGQATIASVEESMGIHRSKGGSPESRKDRVRVVAEELVRMMKAVDMVPSHDLLDVVVGK